MQPRTTTSNDRNVAFYNAIEMSRFTASAGLADCADLDTLEQVLAPDPRALRVLEVGAGYGRVVRRLLTKGYRQVHAIERSVAADEIESEHAAAIAAGHLTLHRRDLREFEVEKRFDLILWMFSGIADFSPREQQEVLSVLASHLAPGGKLVVDLPPVSRTNATLVIGKTQFIEMPGLPTYHGTVPTTFEIICQAEVLSFASVQRIHYRPIAGHPERDRFLFVLAERGEAALARAA